MKFEVPVYGSDEAIADLRPTYGMGGVPEPSRYELASMQNSPYLLHAKNGKMSRVPANKIKLDGGSVASTQRIHAAIGSDGTIYFSYGNTLSKSTDGGRTWSTHELSLEASPNSGFQVLGNGMFVGVGRMGESQDPSVVTVWASENEGQKWEKLSEIDNPSWSPVRYPDTLCRLPDDTLLLPVESRFQYHQDPNYVHRSTDGGITWSGPVGQYAEPAFVETHWVGPNTGPGYLGGFCYETMISRMTSGKLVAVIRYHGAVVPHWPLIGPGQNTFYKTVFLADSEDQGDTWKNLRPLTNVHGQCHGFGVCLSDGTMVVSYDHRYIPGAPSGRAMISLDEGETFEDEVYYISFSTVPEGQAGFSESVVLEDDTILTIAATTDMARDKFLKASTSGKSQNGNVDVWAIRWKLE